MQLVKLPGYRDKTSRCKTLDLILSIHLPIFDIWISGSSQRPPRPHYRFDRRIEAAIHDAIDFREHIVPYIGVLCNA
jgi:hypothetical protein